MEERGLDKRLLLALAAIAAIVIALGIQMCGGPDTSSPDAAVQSYFSAIADGDGEEACEIATQEFQAEAAASVVGTPSEGETCAEAVDNTPEEARELIEDVAVETAETAGDGAVVEVTIDSDDFPPDPLRFDLVRDDDGWLIADLEDQPPAPAG
jgi:hypothetical protein